MVHHSTDLSENVTHRPNMWINNIMHFWHISFLNHSLPPTKPAFLTSHLWLCTQQKCCLFGGHITCKKLGNLLLGTAEGKTSQLHTSLTHIAVVSSRAFHHPVHLTLLWAEHWSEEKQMWNQYNESTMTESRFLLPCPFSPHWYRAIKFKKRYSHAIHKRMILIQLPLAMPKPPSAEPEKCSEVWVSHFEYIF